MAASSASAAASGEAVKLTWIMLHGIAHRRQVLRGVIVVDAPTFEAAIATVIERMPADVHARDLVMGQEVDTEEIEDPALRELVEGLPRLQLLQAKDLEARGVPVVRSWPK